MFVYLHCHITEVLDNAGRQANYQFELLDGETKTYIYIGPND